MFAESFEKHKEHYKHEWCFGRKKESEEIKRYSTLCLTFNERLFNITHGLSYTVNCNKKATIH